MAGNLKLSSSTRLVEVKALQNWKIERLGVAGTLEWSIIGSLVFLVIIGFGLRIHQLGASGFAEDEINKLNAVRSYERGDFTANGEHPMVMKVLIWGSLNAIPASDEVALRLPNALIGALTCVRQVDRFTLSCSGGARILRIARSWITCGPTSGAFTK